MGQRFRRGCSDRQNIAAVVTKRRWKLGLARITISADLNVCDRCNACHPLMQFVVSFRGVRLAEITSEKTIINGVANNRVNGVGPGYEIVGPTLAKPSSGLY